MKKEVFFHGEKVAEYNIGWIVRSKNAKKALSHVKRNKKLYYKSNVLISLLREIRMREFFRKLRDFYERKCIR